MSAALVTNEIEKFLNSKEPEVLCIRGKWGVVKTYTWNDRFEKARAAKTIPLPRYSYVSLFGLNSLTELKFAIFENVTALTDKSEKRLRLGRPELRHACRAVSACVRASGDDDELWRLDVLERAFPHAGFRRVALVVGGADGEQGHLDSLQATRALRSSLTDGEHG